VVDDSIVRGTTCRKIIGMIRSAGAKEIHMRIASPPTMYSCFYGIDTPTNSELIASANSIEAIKGFLGGDTLAYLSRERMLEIFGEDKEDFCTACFDGKYPVARPGMDIQQSELFDQFLAATKE